MSGTYQNAAHVSAFVADLFPNARKHSQVDAIDRFAVFERSTKSLLDGAVRDAPRQYPLKANQGLGVCRITDAGRAGAAVTAALDSRSLRLLVDNGTSFENALISYQRMRADSLGPFGAERNALYRCPVGRSGRMRRRTQPGVAWVRADAMEPLGWNGGHPSWQAPQVRMCRRIERPGQGRHLEYADAGSL
jgi:hypothetical protein